MSAKMKKIKYYKVGGCVRDELLNVPCKDIDYAVECSSFEELRLDILSKGGTIFLENPEFLTIRARLNGENADFVCCRSDGEYKDGRHPTTTEIGNIQSDLARRDFTMNAIAKDEDGNYIDPYNGIHDAKNGIIKCVGSPKERFTEDGLRILRALRFSICKKMMLDQDIVYFMTKHNLKNYLHGVSIERVREELLKMFKADTIKTMDELSWFGLSFIFKDTGLWLKPTMES